MSSSSTSTTYTPKLQAKESDCSICLNPFDGTRVLRAAVFPCGHRNYCKNCLFTWVDNLVELNHQYCPACRTLIERIIFEDFDEGWVARVRGAHGWEELRTKATWRELVPPGSVNVLKYFGLR